MRSEPTRLLRRRSTSLQSKRGRSLVRDAATQVAGRFIEALEKRQLLSIVTPSHIVVVIEEDRGANAIGDTANMPYTNQLAGTGLVYSNSLDLNSTSQEGQMNYLALYSGSTQGVTTNGYSGPFTGGNLAQSLNNKGLSFSGYSEAMPRDGDTTDAYAASPTNSKYDDLYVRAYNPMAQFSNVGTGKTNAQVNQTFASFPTTAAGYAAMPTVSFVIPDTLHNTHGSNDTDPYATDPSQYNFLRQTADAWLKTNLDGYVQWAKQNNSLLIITGDEGDRAHGFTSLATNKVTTIITGDSRLVVPGVDATSINPYTLLRTLENMYGVTPLGNSSTAATVDVNALGQLAAPGAQAASTTTLSANINPTVFGQSVTFTATVTGTGTPSGTVTFKDGTTTLGTGTLNASGVATFATSGLSVATHSITASYGGNANFLASGSPTLTDTVSKASITVAANSSANSSSFGQSVTFSATVAPVAPGSGTPTGTIQFTLDGSNFGTPVTLSGGTATSVASSSLAVGSHSIGAVYSSDSSFLASTAAAISQTVNQAATLTALSSSASTSAFGQGLIFTALVTVPSPGAGTPTGTVTFKDGATLLGTGTLNSSGAATFAISSLTVASHSITALYGGATSYLGSASSALAQTVNQASTATSLTSSANPAVLGQGITFTAAVAVTGSGAGTPSGTVTFKDGSTTLGTGTLSAAGVATFSTSSLSVASHSITAAYSGNTNFLTSASAVLSEQVNSVPALATTTAVVSSTSPSVYGQPITFTATVSAVPSGSGTPTGTVQFVIDGANVGSPVSLSNGSAASAAIGNLTVGSHSVSAIYSGDATFGTSTSSALAQTVGQASTSTSLTSSANPSSFGQSLTFTATVAVSSPGAGAATGVATFKDGATTLGTGTLNVSGAATFTTTSLSAASHSITASYGGATNFVASSSSALAQVVSAAATVGTTASLVSSANPVLFGQPVTFSATVAGLSGSLTPTGTVTFKDGTATLGTGTLNASKVATFTTSSLSAAVHSITAVYSGDANFSTSTSAALSQTITQSATQSPAITSVGSSTGAKSIVTPSHVVIVVLSYHASNEIGDVTNMPYLNSLAAGGLVYSNSHGLNLPTQGSMMNYLALYSGSTQGATSDSAAGSFSGTDLGAQLNAKLGVGNGFVGYAESLPSDGSQVTSASGTAQGQTFSDAYNRAYNPVAMFDAATNAQMDKTFAEFPTNFANLPAVSLVMPNMLDSTHGSNAQAPWAGSTDAANNNQLKQWSDAWLKQNLDAYAQWARNNNSLLIITTSGGDKTNGFTSLATNNLTTIINGAAGLVVPGTDTTSVNPYNLLRTIEDMYGLAPLGSAATASDVDRNALGQLAPVSQTPAPAVAGQALSFTATVAAAGHGAGIPTGTVQFTIDGANFGTPVTLVNGSAASLSTGALSVGNHAISAIYSGDGNFTSAGTINLTQAVSQATTLTAVTSSASSSTAGQGVTFTATVSAVSPGSGTPTGTVQFVIDGVNYGSPVTLSGGVAVSPTISSLAAGNHTVWAVYSSDVNFVASTAATFTQTVV